jgi:hypothetical protein
VPDHGSLPALLKVPVSRDYPGKWRLNEPGQEIHFKVFTDDPFNSGETLLDRPYRIDFYAIPLLRTD